MKQHIPWGIIINFLNREESASEKSDLEKWLNSSKKNVELFRQIEQTWVISKSQDTDFQIDTKKAWAKIQQQLPTNTPQITSNKFELFREYWKYAAIILFSFLTWSLYTYFDSNQQYMLVETNSLQKKSIKLSDGTQVWLNQNSTLKYPEQFEGEERHLYFTGEAFFQVTPNPEKPFIISSNKLTIKVLGTSFNFRAYADESQKELSVVSGKVSFKHKKSKALIVKAQEKAVFDKVSRQFKKQSSGDENFLAWKTGKLVFKDQTFQEIARELSRYYQTDFVIKNSNLRKEKLTVSFDNQQLSEVIKVLEATLNAQARLKKKRVVFSR